MYTQYPMEASKFWNVINLFTTESWSWIVGTIFMVILTLKISTYAGRNLGVKTGTEEITLVPYRSKIFGSVRSSRSHNVRSFIGLVQTCLELLNFIFLSQVSLR